MQKNKKARYNITLSETIEKDLDDLHRDYDMSKSEVIQRSIELLKHAIKADKVVLIKGKEEQTVRLK